MASGATLSDRFTAATHKATGKAERTIRAAAQRSEHVAEWIRLAEKKADESVADTTCVSNDLRADGRRKGPQHQESGVRAASRDLGVN